jgi:hypothetical protein
VPDVDCRGSTCGIDMRSVDCMRKCPWKLLARTPLLHRMRITASQPAAGQYVGMSVRVCAEQQS